MNILIILLTTIVTYDMLYVDMGDTENKKTFIERILSLETLLKEKSYFLFGPRQTGKSSLIRHSLQTAKVFNLLDDDTYKEFNVRPGRLKEETVLPSQIIVIDEIQRIPQLLNLVHLLIEERGTKFLLTGSSARKLRARGTNLLGGRARVANLHPLVSNELKDLFDLNKALNIGLLPSIYFSDAPLKDLESYIGAYLKNEVAAEALTRNVPAFARFLTVASLCNARIVNFSNVANDAQVKRATVYDYFEILKDTLLLHELPPFLKGASRKPLRASKFYFFDTGVVRQLQGRTSVALGTPEFGDAFETFIINEFKAFGDYVRPLRLNYWQSLSGIEVDLIVDEHIAIEVKGKQVIGPDDLKSLKAISQENSFKKLYCACLESRPRKVGDIEIIPYQELLKMLWGGMFF